MKLKRIFCLVLCVTFMVAAAVPTQAVAGVDDLVVWGVVSLLAAWGITFTVADATQSQVAEKLLDLFDAAGVAVQSIGQGAAVLAAPGILKLQPAVFNAARTVANYIKTHIGGNTGSFEMATPETGLGFVSGLTLPYSNITRYVSSWWCAVDAAYPIFSVGQSDVTYDLGNGYTLYLTNYEAYVYIVWYKDGQIIGQTATTNRSGRPAQFNDVIIINDDGRYKLASWYRLQDGTRYADYINLSGAMDTFPSACLVGSVESGLAMEAVADGAAVPEDEEDKPVYTGAPGFGYTTAGGAADAFTSGMSGTGTYPQTAVYTDQYAAENARDSVVPVVNPIGVADDYTVSGLASVFPFCIPFDLYDMYAALRANREAPNVSWRFYVPDLVDYTFDIDLSPYDGAAQVLRTMELLAFCVGLALATKKLLGW